MVLFVQHISRELSENNCLRDGIPYHKHVLQLTIPAVLQDDLLHSNRESLAGGGHQGVDCTYKAIKLKYFWPTVHHEAVLSLA